MHVKTKFREGKYLWEDFQKKTCDESFIKKLTKLSTDRDNAGYWLCDGLTEAEKIQIIIINNGFYAYLGYTKILL